MHAHQYPSMTALHCDHIALYYAHKRNECVAVIEKCQRRNYEQTMRQQSELFDFYFSALFCLQRADHYAWLMKETQKAYPELNISQTVKVF